MQLSFVLSAAVLLLSNVASATSAYSKTCSSTGVDERTGDGIYLTGRCGNGKGGYNNAQLKLGTCLGNDNGQIVAQTNGAFGVSCTNCGGISGGGPGQYANTNLMCQCKNDAGDYVSSSYNLYNIVGNVGGNLVCN